MKTILFFVFIFVISFVSKLHSAVTFAEIYNGNVLTARINTNGWVYMGLPASVWIPTATNGLTGSVEALNHPVCANEETFGDLSGLGAPAILGGVNNFGTAVANLNSVVSSYLNCCCEEACSTAPRTIIWEYDSGYGAGTATTVSCDNNKVIVGNYPLPPTSFGYSGGEWSNAPGGVNDHNQVLVNHARGSGSCLTSIYTDLNGDMSTGPLPFWNGGVISGSANWYGFGGQDINNYGQVAGWTGFGNDTAYVTNRAVLWTPSAANGTSGVTVNLGYLSVSNGYDGYSSATAVNDYGVVVGVSGEWIFGDEEDPYSGAAHNLRAFIWIPTGANETNGTMYALGELSGDYTSSAMYLNDVDASGVVKVVGKSGSRAVLWEVDIDDPLLLERWDLSANLTNSTSVAYAINNTNQIVVFSGKTILYNWTYPSIDIYGNGNLVVDGDTTPSLSDHTDFGSTAVSGGTIVRTFTIANSGSQAISVSAINVSGVNAGDFTVGGITLPVLVPNGSKTFTVTFDPSASGLRSATVTIDSNASNISSYDFAIEGTGTP